MIDHINELALAIEQLEKQSSIQKVLLKEEAKKTYESLRPVNLLKKSITELGTPDFKNNALNAGISLLAGYASKKAIVGASHNPLKQLMGTLLQVVVTKLVSKNADTIRSNSGELIKKITDKYLAKEK
ncbi:MAG: hypothetical protein IT236_15375 [Bacteroidia bacterium]|nr:hypothetical protein [Bacteroidia bacterium]